MHSELDRSSKGKSLLVFIIGTLVIVFGVWALMPTWKIFNIVYSEFNSPGSPYNYATMIYSSLWLLAAVCTVIAGISLIISALSRKQYDLIPGPTLYFLGLALAVIGGFLIMNGLGWQAITAIFIGLFLIYWEWAYHVS